MLTGEAEGTETDTVGGPAGERGGDDMGRKRLVRTEDEGGKGGRSLYVRTRWAVMLPGEWRDVVEMLTAKFGGTNHAHIQTALVAYAKAMGVPCPDEPIEFPVGRKPVGDSERARLEQERAERAAKQEQWKRDRDKFLAGAPRKRPKKDT